MTKLDEITRIVFEQCFALSSSETILIVTDGKETELVDSFYCSASALAVETLLLQFTPRSRHGEEPPHLVAQALHLDGLILSPTLTVDGILVIQEGRLLF